MHVMAGWLGTFLVVVAYGLNVAGLVGSGERLYLALNLLGALLLGCSLWSVSAWPAFTLQVIWGLVAVVGLSSRGRG